MARHLCSNHNSNMTVRYILTAITFQMWCPWSVTFTHKWQACKTSLLHHALQLLYSANRIRGSCHCSGVARKQRENIINPESQRQSHIDHIRDASKNLMGLPSFKTNNKYVKEPCLVVMQTHRRSMIPGHRSHGVFLQEIRKETLWDALPGTFLVSFHYFWTRSQVFLRCAERKKKESMPFIFTPNKNSSYQ